MSKFAFCSSVCLLWLQAMLLIFQNAVNSQYYYRVPNYGYGVPGVPALAASMNAPCMPRVRVYNPGACVLYMRRALADPNLFWFGSQLRAICENSNPEEGNVTCDPFIPDDAAPWSYQTMGARIFQDPNYLSNCTIANEILYPITVTYTSEPETVTGCNTTQQNSQTLRFDVNPNMSPLGNFYYRNTPEVYAPSCTTTTLCTLVFFDVGGGNIHNIWTNFPKEPLTDYVAPGTQRFNVNPYAWLAFQQSYEITNFTLSKPEGSPTFMRYGVSISELKDNYGLRGPVGMTWLLSTHDIYTEGYHNTIGLASIATRLCTGDLDTRLRADACVLYQDLSLLLPSELGAFLAVKYDDGSTEFWLDPFECNPRVGLSSAITEPELFLYPRTRLPADEVLAERTYVLMLVRKELNSSVNVPSTFQCGFNVLTQNDGSVFVHWLKTDVPGDDLTGGDEVLPYYGPNTAPDRYYLLLYRMDGELTSTDLLADDCQEGFDQRCRFPLQQYVRENNLRLEALSRFATGYSR